MSTPTEPGETRMTFGEHLEVLRWHVLRCVIYTLVVSTVCFWFQDELMQVLIWPHQRAMEGVQADFRAIRLRERLPGADDQLPALEALVEGDRQLRQRLLDLERNEVALSPDLHAADIESVRQELVRLTEEQDALRREQEALLARPPADRPPEALRALHDRRVAVLDRALGLEARLRSRLQPVLPPAEASGESGSLHFLRYQEVFLNYFKVSLICALLMASPLIFMELWKFVADGLYPHERSVIRFFAPLSFVSFAGGVAFGYFVLIPIGLRFLATYGHPDAVTVSITISDYLGLFFTLTLLVGIIFELPLILFFLSMVGVVDVDTLRAYRRYWILAAFIIAALLTPPDPVTQTLLAIPMLLLYEAGIWLIRVAGPPPRPRDPDAEVVP